MLKLRCRHDVGSAVRYFTSDPALSEHEKRGQWSGTAAVGLGIKPQVTSSDLTSMLNGFSPAGRPLFSRRSDERRSSWEVVLAPHKSISVGALCADESERERVRGAWDSACSSMVRTVESLSACQNNGAAPIRTQNVAAAVFSHEFSRHGDPHLHTHILLMNATFDLSSRKWRSLEPSPIYKAQIGLDAVFHRELCRELQIRGLNASLNAEGVAELPISESTCSRMSKAHTLIQQLATRLPPDLNELNRKTAENRINDRTRPRKKLVSDRPTMSSDERRQFKRVCETPPLREKPMSIPEALERLERSLREVSLILNTRSKWRAIANAAAQDLRTPIEPLIEAADLLTQPFLMPTPEALADDEILAIRAQQVQSLQKRRFPAEIQAQVDSESQTPTSRENLESDHQSESVFRSSL